MAVNTAQNVNPENIGAIDLPLENEEFLTFQDSTNEFRDPENIQKDILHGKIRVLVRSVASSQ